VQDIRRVKHLKGKTLKAIGAFIYSIDIDICFTCECVSPRTESCARMLMEDTKDQGSNNRKTTVTNLVQASTISYSNLSKPKVSSRKITLLSKSFPRPN